MIYLFLGGGGGGLYVYIFGRLCYLTSIYFRRVFTTIWYTVLVLRTAFPRIYQSRVHNLHVTRGLYDKLLAKQTSYQLAIF